MSSEDGGALHWSLMSERVLFASVILDSFTGFVIASLLTAAICISERFLTHVLNKRWAPMSSGLYRTRLALWRTFLYAVATFLRLCYMLIAMSLHMGLLLMIVVTLSLSQFIIELISLPKPAPSPLDSEVRGEHHPASVPLLADHQPEQAYPLTSRSSQSQRSRRSRSKPEDIFIHPAESNIARADAVAIELGLSGETERVKHYTAPQAEDPVWQNGTGRNKARELMSGSTKKKGDSDKIQPFFADDDSDTDSF